MIERKFVDDKKKELEIAKFIEKKVKRAGFSSARLIKTPLGDKIVVSAVKPGLVVGPKGRTIKALTETLRSRYKLENPQIEVEEVKNSKQDPKVVANYIVFSLERFGTRSYKGAVYRSMRDILASGAHGVEIIVSGKIPSSRSKNWRFQSGYFKKSGDIALNGVRRTIVQAKLKTGVVGVKVSILPGEIEFPDKMDLKEIVEEVTDDKGNVEETKTTNLDSKEVKEEIKAVTKSEEKKEEETDKKE